MGAQERSWTGRGAVKRVLGPALLLALLPSTVAIAGSPSRQKAGPVTIRGVAWNVTSTGFVLQTKSAGAYSVQVARDTSITEKGKSGRQVVRDGDHVGVRGFVTGRNIRAMSVHIYPTKTAPKGYTVIGTVQSVGPGYIVVGVGAKLVRIALRSTTVIRVGSVPGTSGDLRAGERVRVHVIPAGREIAATSIHVYRSASAAPEQIDGTVIQVTPASVTVRQGATTYRIGLTGSTRFYQGATSTGASAVHIGQTVRVYACCRGQPLVARSIHIKRVSQTRASVTLRGSVISIFRGTLVLAVGTSTVRLVLRSSTAFEVGTTHVSASGIQTGDAVTVRAYRDGGELVATRVHVLASSRRTRRITGVVVSVSAGRLTVLAHGVRYVVVVPASASVTLGGGAAALGSLRPGDRVIVTVRQSSSTLVATLISGRRIPPRVRVLHGTVTGLRPIGFTMTDAAGTSYLVILGHAVRPTLSGSPAPAAALFVGVHVTVRGTLSGKTVTATSVALSVRSQILSGRVRSSRSSLLTVASRGAAVKQVDVPSGVQATDGSQRHAVSWLHVGTYVRVRGYAETNGRLRATAISVQHPVLTLTGTVSATSPQLLMQTSSGERYRLSISTGSQVSAERAQIDISAADVAVGAHVHATGTMRSDGALAVDQLVVRLVSTTFQGTVEAAGAASLTVKTAMGTEQVHAQGVTSVSQGSKSIDLSAIVPGDDVTVTGYRSGRGWTIARKIQVHRKLVGLDGTVSELNGDTFTLSAKDGLYHVVTSPATQISGAALSTGVAVHVTGYRRGDGIILATRIRVGK